MKDLRIVIKSEDVPELLKALGPVDNLKVRELYAEINSAKNIQDFRAGRKTIPTK